MRIALAGNPNSGKTTLFNAITGKLEYVGNWPGVTVAKKEADVKKNFIKDNEEIRIVDLPGAYSIAPLTSEEAITRDFVLNENLDVVINIVDGANLSRSLFFTTQLLELGVPVVIALNKTDIIESREDTINIEKLSKALKCPVIKTVATKDAGLSDLISAAYDARGAVQEFTSFDDDYKRQEYIDKIVDWAYAQGTDSHKVNISDKIDRIVAHRFFGLPIFFLVMWAVYWLAIVGPGGQLSEYLNESLFGETIPEAASAFFESMSLNPMLQSLLVDGVIAGVGAVIGFLPLIMVLFFCLGLLEDSGYMARVAVVMDQYFKKLGLSGKSIIPMIVGSGCAIPGVMATRTIEDDNERRMTTILAPFVPCGAKLPIIAMISAAFFPENSWVAPSMYVLAIVMIILGGLFLKKIFVWENTSFFMMELPEYKIPSIKHAFKQMMSQAKAFIYKASTIILVMNTLVWFMQAYDWTLQPVEDQSASILAGVGGAIAPILIPLGFIGWQLAAATITGFIAKENVVTTFAVLLAVASEEALLVAGGPLNQLFNPVTAYAFLVFNLFTPPCFAAIGAMNAELDSKKWLAKALAFQLGIGYVLAMLVAQFGTIIVYGHVLDSFIPAMIVLAGFVLLSVYLIKNADKKRTELSHMDVGATAKM